ncbi:MAG: arginine--tRNA ligase [Syntrophomonadaceae bacterium]|nr:arginine--tRNA ligase [Syntrophomonadaceae bacterium]
MNAIETNKKNIQAIVNEALRSAQQKGLLSFQDIPDYVIEVPREKEHGDFASNVALLMARQARMSPKAIAGIIMDEISLDKIQELEKIEVAGAGFINFFLNNSWLFEIPVQIVKMGNKYGYNDYLNRKVQVEFVSANPTGNLHMGNARGGAIGDTLANILQRAGYDVEREFYVNDAGNQIEIFAESLEARYLQLTGNDIKFPDNGYAGQDVIQTVKNIIREKGNSLVEMDSETRRKIIVEYALQEKIDYIKATLKAFGIEYDHWFSEQSLHDSGKVEEVIKWLTDQGFIYEHEGALWFKSVQYGDEKDEVIKRANGLTTYFAADIAYHKDKFERGFDWVINVWGADHHGHVARMKGAMQALGLDPAKLDILLMQLVRLYRGGNIVRMSKRTGTTISLDELIEEVGKDAARFFFVMRSPDSHLDFDMQLAKEKSQENPVYYVQYAHARICSIFRQAAAAGVKMASVEEIDSTLLNSQEEIDLLRRIADFPDEILIAARTLSPHRIARYVLDVAGLFHSFYNHHRVLTNDEPLQNARLLLMQVTQITLKNALDTLGVSAPEQM